MTQDEIMKWLEDIKWGDRVISPFKPNSKVYNHPEPFTYMCKDSNRQFTVLTNTFLAYDRKQLEVWKMFVDMLVARVNEVDVAHELQVSEVTRKLMYRKLFKAMHLPEPSMSRDLHFFLMRSIKSHRYTSEYIFKKLLVTHKVPRRVGVRKKKVEAGLKRNK